ncbi:pleckstrin homology domain-containing family A member 5 isoform X20 [Monodelphis domestica]|uniref:pleckstrin homology domain-containing family A member 5 isoform X20 n=1 Tax=Monodelphis domestica TaxID=13616 RepID=UPI0024E259B3|nr:pleckstrin homology domain-containing family A member 5 isoform X20 [Monodelphis domestica]
MAADLNLEWICSLPPTWTYGITKGGRVFFINEEAKSTTWLHPVTGEAVVTGHRRQSPDLPTGWEEAYTFEGARYYIKHVSYKQYIVGFCFPFHSTIFFIKDHNERKVTCKHPVTGQPSQDNCIFVVNEQTTTTMTSEEKKERPISMINEAANYNLTSDYAVHPVSPVGRSSRSSKKVHNFGKRSNSIKRNPNAPVVRRGWLYKQDSTGMKLWKKRWFVLSDLCLFYYRDEKEEGILGSILLPSFQIAMLTSEDHINRKHAFKAAHPNMRTYYFCTDTGKEMELWMKAMLDAALVQTEPVKRVDKIPSEKAPSREVNNISNHRVLIKPEMQSSQKKKEVRKIEEKRALEAEKYGFQKDGQDRPLTKINSVKLNSLPSEYESLTTSTNPPGRYRPAQTNGSDTKAVNVSLADLRSGSHPNTVPVHMESDRVIQRTNSMLQLEQWIKIQKGKGHEEEPRGVISYQTLPRNMPSHRTHVVPRYPEGYRTLPRNTKTRPESICGITPSAHDRTMGAPTEDKRRSMRDDTMWQLYEWQQRQFYSKQSTLPRHGTLSSPKTMINISDQAMHSIPTSPSHGSIAAYQGYSPQRTFRSEVSSPIQRGDITVDRRHRTHHPKHVFVPDRRSMPAGLTLQPVNPQSLQGKTNEILSHHLQKNTLYLDHQLSQDEYRGTLYKYRSEEVDIDAKLSRLCEQDKVVHALEEKLQQLHKEKYMLEQALLSASQEIEMNADNPAAIQNVVLQRDDLQNGLLSTCRELSRATAELERAWREYDKLEYDVTITRNQMQEQLDRLGEVQTESAGIQRAQIQKELWRIQDVMEGLSKHKQHRGTTEAGMLGSKTFTAVKYKNEGPDYRLYKSEPELTTVAEVDESNGEEKSEPVSEIESVTKGSHFPIGVVPPRTKSPMPESSTIASYVTLRKTKKTDIRTERPRSAVEQLCLAESTRPRMTLEEQMERIKRRQQACLREKKKGLTIIGTSDQSPLQSPSFCRDNPFRVIQNQRDDLVSSNIKELENLNIENNIKPNLETSAEEVAQLNETVNIDHQDVDFSKELLKTDNNSFCESLFKSEPSEENSEEIMDKQKDREEMSDDISYSPQIVAPITNHKSEGNSEEKEIANVNKQEGNVISYETMAETSRGNQAITVKTLPPSPEPSTSPVPPAQPPLPEGSHFIYNSFC